MISMTMLPPALSVTRQCAVGECRCASDPNAIRDPTHSCGTAFPDTQRVATARATPIVNLHTIACKMTLSAYTFNHSIRSISNLYSPISTLQSLLSNLYSVTVNSAPPLRPHTSGKYIISPCTGNTRNSPGSDARTWKVYS